MQDQVVAAALKALERLGRGAADHAVYLVALLEQELGQVAAVLSGDAGDQCAPRIVTRGRLPFRDSARRLPSPELMRASGALAGSRRSGRAVPAQVARPARGPQSGAQGCLHRPCRRVPVAPPTCSRPSPDCPCGSSGSKSRLSSAPASATGFRGAESHRPVAAECPLATSAGQVHAWQTARHHLLRDQRLFVSDRQSPTVALR